MQDTTVAPAPIGTEPVIIVAGLPRSGTSMTMKMLQAGGVPVIVDGLRVADEDNRGGYFEFEPVKRLKSDASWLEQAAGKAVKMVYRLLYDLPADRRYQVIFTHRKMEEVLASQKKMLERQGAKTEAADEQRLAALFKMELARVEAWLKRQPNFQVLDVNYNDLVANPRESLLPVKQFLAGQFDIDAAAAVVNASQYRNRC